MNRWIRRTVLALGGLAAALATTVAGGLALAEWRQAQRLEVPPRPIALRDDAASREHGAYLYRSRGCQDCHGADGAGREFVNDGAGLVIRGPQIAPGPASVTARYGAADWERTIRHGVDPAGRALRVMPSQDYAGLADADLEALVAHLRSMPAVQGDARLAAGEVRLPPVVRVMYGLGVIPDAASRIDHRQDPPRRVTADTSAEYGRYVAQMCSGCHGPQLAGGKIPGGPPEWPAAANLRGDILTRYPTPDALARMLRGGRRPDGSTIQVMPFESLSHLNDTEVTALHAYLRTLQGKS